MKIVLRKLSDVLQGTARVDKQSPKALPIRETERNLITKGTTVPEVWIMSGLVLSLVTQIAYANLLRKLGAKLDDNQH